MNEFSVQAVESSFFDYFASLAAPLPVHVDAEPFDPEGKDSWIQFAVTAVDSGPVRKTDLDELRVRVVAHCWSRLTTDAYAGLSLSDFVVSILQHAVVDVRDFLASGEPIVGTLQLWEPTQKDMTDSIDDELRADWQYVMVQCDGRAQET